MSRNLLVGVDIGGTKTAVCLWSEPPQDRQEGIPVPLCRTEFATEPKRGPQPAIELIVRAIRESLSHSGPDRFPAPHPSAIGVMRGTLDSAAGGSRRRPICGHGWTCQSMPSSERNSANPAGSRMRQRGSRCGTPVRSGQKEPGAKLRR